MVGVAVQPRQQSGQPLGHARQRAVAALVGVELGTQPGGTGLPDRPLGVGQRAVAVQAGDRLPRLGRYAALTSSQICERSLVASAPRNFSNSTVCSDDSSYLRLGFSTIDLSMYGSADFIT